MEIVSNLFRPVLAAATEGEAHGAEWNIFYYVGLVFLIVFIFMALARPGITGYRSFKNLPAKLAEQIYFFFKHMTTSVIGPHGMKYIPMLMALWLFIFTSNVLGLFFPATPTADWSLNLSLAIVTMLYVWYEGIKANGVVGFLRHFAGPKLFGLMVLVNVMIFIVEIISELMKFFSLSLRLYGNIEGGHIVKESLDKIIDGVPLGGMLIAIKLLTCVLQAYIFTVLMCLYLSLVTSHDEEHDEHEHIKEHSEHSDTAIAPQHST